MSYPDNNEVTYLWWVGVVLFVIFSFTGCFRLWWARHQAEVWQKQGVEISTTEVFFGVHPAGTPGGQR